MDPVFRSIALIVLLSVLLVLLVYQRKRDVAHFTPGNGWINDFFQSVFVISSTEAKPYMLEVMAALEITPDYVKRVAPNDLKRTALIDEEIITEECTLSMAVVANNMSHIAALSAFLQTSDVNTAFICEDTVTKIPAEQLPALKTKFGQVMANVPNDWEIINFGRCLDKCTDNTAIAPNLLSSTGALCRYAYAVSRAGAEKIAVYIKTLKGSAPGDEIIAAYARAGKLKMYVPDKAFFVENLADAAVRDECVSETKKKSPKP
jgi:hypothetical protein